MKDHPVPKDDDLITISHREYNDLIARSKQLRRLEAAGVDNWEGYPELEDDED